MLTFYLREAAKLCFIAALWIGAWSLIVGGAAQSQAPVNSGLMAAITIAVAGTALCIAVVLVAAVQALRSKRP